MSYEFIRKEIKSSFRDITSNDYYTCYVVDYILGCKMYK